MLTWYFIMWENKSGDPYEWSVIRTKPEFLLDEMEQYLKFGAVLVAGKAYPISPEIGRPDFRKKPQTVGLPF